MGKRAKERREREREREKESRTGKKERKKKKEKKKTISFFILFFLLLLLLFFFCFHREILRTMGERKEKGGERKEERETEGEREQKEGRFFWKKRDVQGQGRVFFSRDHLSLSFLEKKTSPGTFNRARSK